ncbi:MAG: hypothetical protein M5R42_18770 [Rhodocyclaceae bacterium]|nr:hypothetical protein [Rhodocyclaceae bacterium]
MPADSASPNGPSKLHVGAVLEKLAVRDRLQIAPHRQQRPPKSVRLTRRHPAPPVLRYSSPPAALRAPWPH